MSFYLSSNQSRKVIPVLLKVSNIYIDQNNNSALVVIGDLLEWATGKIVRNNIIFNLVTNGMNTGFNYSIGEAFGSLVEFYGEDAGFGVKKFDISQLVGHEVIGFVHYRKTEHLLDVFPLAGLQFPWMQQTNVKNANSVVIDSSENEYSETEGSTHAGDFNGI